MNAQFAPKLARMLAALNTAKDPRNLNAPNYRLHQLKGDRDSQWSIWVSGNWRLVFEFDGEDVTNVDLVDYH
jgi:toxin HigB-1